MMLITERMTNFRPFTTEHERHSPIALLDKIRMFLSLAIA